MLRPRLDRRPGSLLKVLSVQSLAPLSHPPFFAIQYALASTLQHSCASSQSAYRPNALRHSHRILTYHLVGVDDAYACATNGGNISSNKCYMSYTSTTDAY